jgi:hypothetical protein
MKKELEDQIISIAPYMYRYAGWDNPHLSLMCFGFECGDGWFDILKHLTEEITKVDPYKECKVFQVKEKYGTLRFYIEDGNDEIDKLIENAEKKTLVTCEECGKIGTLRTDRWWRVTCDECEKEKNEG